MRKRFKSWQYQIRVVLLLLCALLMGERELRAYTDPSTTAALWQVLMAAFIGGMFYARRFIGWISGRKKNTSVDE